MLCDLCVLCGEKRGVFINILIYFYAAPVPGASLPGKMPDGATDAMVHPDACFHINCHDRYQICERREPYDRVPVWIWHTMRAEVSVKITCLCFPKPQINADGRRFDLAWRRKQMS
jgi:hypothetical protein